MTPDEAFDRPHRAGRTVGEIRLGSTWLVSGHNGENLIRATGATQTEGWRRACGQPAAVGMLAPEKAGSWRR